MREMQDAKRENLSRFVLRVAARCIVASSDVMKTFTRLRWRYVVASALVLAVLCIGVVHWQTGRALRAARQEVRSAGELSFTVRSLTPITSSFEWISAPASFSGAAVFRGRFFACGASGLFEYDERGALVKHYRPGKELPPTFLVRMTKGVLRDSHEPELLIVTAGDGVLAFNGTDFRQILPADSDVRAITSILPTGSGQLLIGTRKRGVVAYDGQKLQVFHPTLAALHVTELAGNEDDLWVGTQDQGLVHWQGGRAETFTEAQGLPDNQIFSIALRRDRAYAGTAVGIAEFERGRFVRVLAPGAFVRTLYASDSGLLAGGGVDGLLEIDLSSKRQTGVLHPAARTLNDVQAIFRSGDRGDENSAGGAMLYAVTSREVYARESQRGGWRRVLSPESTLLADHNISALALDSSQHLWVGYFDRGLDVFEPDLHNAAHIEDDNVFCINRILPSAANGTVAVATANGLVLFDQLGRKQQVLRRSDGLLADHVTDAAPYGGGMVLATPAGLTFLDGSGTRSLYAFHGLVNNHVYTVAAAGKEVIAGTLGGISVLRDENVASNYTVATRGLTHNWISAVVREGNDWMVGTYGGGIVRLASGRFETFDVATGKFEVYPNAMLATERHILAGTLGRGLYVYNRSSHRWSVIREGLPSLTVTALAAGNGLIYVGTDNGLVRIPEQDLL